MSTPIAFDPIAPRRYSARAMPILCDYHMHTPRCKHAAGPMEAYVEKAIALGLREVGFSDHNPLPSGLSAQVRMDEWELEHYVQDVLDLRARYRGQINVRLGLEMDYLEGLEEFNRRQIGAHPWDYIIASVHYMDAQCTLGSWSSRLPDDVSTHYTRYFQLIRNLAQSGLCDIIAHFDVPKRSGRPPTEAVAAAITETLEAAAAADVCIEINTSGYRHAELTEPQPYPSLPIVKQMIDIGVPLTVNSDAHSPDQVGTAFATIESFLKTNGCIELMQYDQRKRTSYRI